jgi:hypothetical protein
MRELYLRMGYTHPMLWLGEVLSRPVEELAKELRCKPVEALAEQRKAAADLMPYMESRKPLQIHDDRDRSPNILIVGDVRSVVAGERQAARNGAMAIDDDVLEAVTNHVENQRLAAKAPEQGAQAPGAQEAQGVDIAAETGPKRSDA